MPLTSSGRLRIATLLLIALTIVWGSTFFLIKDLVQTLPSMDFLGVRFIIAAVILTLLTWRQLRRMRRDLLWKSVVLGLFYAAAQVFQTIGLETTAASMSGFITGLYVVLTPILGAIILRTRIPGAVWLAVALALAGLTVLTLGGVHLGIGEALTLGCAIAYTFHILMTARWATAKDALAMTTVQSWVIGIVCIVGGAPDGITLPSGVEQWASMIYMVLFASIAALWVQTWAQAQMPATRAAIIMTMEPVFASAFAVVLGGEALTWRLIAGGALVVAAMYVVELAAARRRAPEPDDVADAGDAPVRMPGE